MPAMWQKTIMLQGFDPTSHMVNKFIEFCKRLKFAKGHHKGEEQPDKKLCNGDESQTGPSGCCKGAQRGLPSPWNEAIKIKDISTCQMMASSASCIMLWTTTLETVKSSPQDAC